MFLRVAGVWEPKCVCQNAFDVRKASGRAYLVAFDMITVIICTYIYHYIQKQNGSRGPNSVTISHAAQRIYILGSVLFRSFLGGRGGPELYGRYLQIVPIITFFRRSRKNVEKHDLRIRMAAK